MSNNEKGAKKGVKTTGVPRTSVKAIKGTISYNKYIDCWQCVDVHGKLVLRTSSKANAINAYPDFVVKG